MTHSDSVSLRSSLLVHDEFLRALARSLLADSDSADDAVQDTYLRAFRSPPRASDKERAFLAVVLGNVVRSMRRRKDALAIARESEETERVGAPDPAEILEREAKRREIVEAVLALDPPQRDAILLRYFEGLSIRESAKRLALPENTVASHLHRARARLRAVLVDASPDPRRSLVVIAGFRSGESATAKTVASGLSAATLAAGLGVVAIATYALFSTVRGDAGSEEPTVARSTPATPEPKEPETAEGPRDFVEPPARAAQTPHRIRGRAIDLEGRAVAGARVVALGPDGTVEATTDASGEFEIRATRQGLVDLTVESARHFPSSLECVPMADSPEPLVETLVLVPGAAIRVEVIDAETEAGIADAALAIGLRGPGQRDFLATCDASGRFSGLVPRRGLELRVEALGYEPTFVRPFVPSDGGAFVLKLRREASGEKLFVRLRDDSGRSLSVVAARPSTIVLHGEIHELEALTEFHGPPIRSGPNGKSPSGFPTAGSTEFGTFVSHSSRSRVARLVLADGRRIEVRTPTDRRTTLEDPLEITVPDSQVLRGAVLDSLGAPVANVAVDAFVTPPHDDVLAFRDLRDVRVITNSDGSFSLPLLPVGSLVRFMVASAGGHVLDAEPVEVSAADSKRVQLVAKRSPPVSGIVVGGNDPLVGARVRMSISVADRSPPNGAPNPEPHRRTIVLATAHTDRDGRFRFDDAPERGSLFIEAHGFAARPTEFQSDSRELELRLEPERVFRGRVVDRAGRIVRGARVFATKATTVRTTNAMMTFGEEETEAAFSRTADSPRIASNVIAAWSDANGEYLVGGLDDGAYTLVAELETAASAPFPSPVVATSAADAPSRDLVLVPTTALLGRIRDSATGASIVPRAHFVSSATRGGTVMAMGEGRATFAHLTEPGRREEIGIELHSGDSIVAVDVSVDVGEWREIGFNAPSSRAVDEQGAELTLDFDSRNPAGAIVSLIDESDPRVRRADLRVGVEGAGHWRATLLGIHPGNYRIEAFLSDGTPVFLAETSVVIARGERKSLVLSPR